MAAAAISLADIACSIGVKGRAGEAGRGVERAEGDHRRDLLRGRYPAQRDIGEQFVFVVEKGENATVRKQPVTPGIRVDDKIEIRSGLADGEEVVVRGQTLLEDGSEVNVVSTVEPLPKEESAR